MKSTAFDYTRAHSLDEALTLLGAPGAMPLAGGHSLVPQLNERALRPDRLVDLSRIDALRRIDSEGGVLRIGAAVRLAELLVHPAVQAWPLLIEALRSTASPAVRSRATLVGNLVRASPNSELPVAARALGARLSIAGPAGVREIDVEDFFVAPHRVAIDQGELVTAIAFAKSPGARAQAFAEIATRNSAPPLVCVAVALALDPAGLIERASVVAGGITGVPSCCARTEAALIGRALDQATGLVQCEELTPLAQLATSAYALQVLPVLIGRALAQLRPC